MVFTRNLSLFAVFVTAYPEVFNQLSLLAVRPAILPVDQGVSGLF